MTKIEISNAVVKGGTLCGRYDTADAALSAYNAIDAADPNADCELRVNGIPYGTRRYAVSDRGEIRGYFWAHNADAVLRFARERGTVSDHATAELSPE